MIAGVAASLIIVGLAAILFWYRRRRQDRAFLKSNIGTPLPFHDTKRPPSDPIMPLIAPYLTPRAHPAFASFLPDIKPAKKERQLRRSREGEELMVLPVLRRESERGVTPMALEQ